MSIDCPLCQSPLEEYATLRADGGTLVVADCAACGAFTLAPRAAEMVALATPQDRARIRARVAEEVRRTGRRARITPGWFADVRELAVEQTTEPALAEADDGE